MTNVLECINYFDVQATNRFILKLREKKYKEEIMELTGKQKAYLRSLGQTLKIVVTVGDKGVSESVIESTNEVLQVRELIKISINHPDRNYRKEAVNELAKATESVVINTIGKTSLLFKENPENPTVSKKLKQ